MTQQNVWKAKLNAYFEKHSMYHRVTAKRDSNVLTVHHWPQMQGQGIDAAGAVEERWDKICKFADQNGFAVVRTYG